MKEAPKKPETGEWAGPVSDMSDISRKRFVETVRTETDPGIRQHTVNMWLNQRLEKRMNATTPEERFRIHLDTAHALRDAWLVNDARDMLEDIAATTQTLNEPDVEQKAQDALKNLPTAH